MKGTLIPGPSLVVAEVYGPAWQGEGPSTGCRCSFIRLMGCDYACTWCDEAHTWDAARYDLHQVGTRTSVGDIITQALACHPDLVVITGGEPLLHQGQAAWPYLLDGLGTRRVEIETNGAHAPTGPTLRRSVHFNVSPKLASSGMAGRRNPDAIAALLATGKASFKFVCTGRADLDEARGLVKAWRIPPHLVWIMPEGVEPDRLLATARLLAPHVRKAGFHFTLRQHVLLYGTAKEPR